MSKIAKGNPISQINLQTSWQVVPDATGYSLELRSSALGEPVYYKALTNDFYIKGIKENGGYLLSVKALGPAYNSTVPDVSFLNSDPRTRFFSVNEFQEDLLTDASFVSNVQIT